MVHLPAKKAPASTNTGVVQPRKGMLKVDQHIQWICPN